MAALIIANSYVLAAGGILTAIITGGFAFVGVIYNARHQQRPRTIKLDPAVLADLRHELDLERSRRRSAELDAERWRSAAVAAMSRPDPSDRPE